MNKNNNIQTQDKTKNWIVGGLIVIILFLGYLAFGKNENNNQTFTKPTTQTEEVEKKATIQQKSECLTAQETWIHIGETRCVEFFVGSPYRSSKGNVFLNEKKNYKNGFTVYIPANSVGNFSKDPISEYGYKTIRVTGLLRMYQGHPEIIVNSPSQIEK